MELFKILMLIKLISLLIRIDLDCFQSIRELLSEFAKGMN